MKIILLTNGGFVTVDDSDYETLLHFSWYAAPRGKTTYAQAYVYGAKRLHGEFACLNDVAPPFPAGNKRG